MESSTFEPDRPQDDRPSVCVFAQQYSSAMLFSLRFHSLEEKFGSKLKKGYYFSLLLFKIA
jgi:hypothetical protein